MHKSALDIGRLFFELYVPEPCVIADIGSLDVNGSLRQFAPLGSEYIGLDFAEGRGVDRLLTDPYKLPLQDESVDVVVSSSCVEHSEFFWLAFLEMARVLRPQGLLYLSAPSNSQFHRYPVDCWRFYPDSGRALQNWAHRNGYDALLLESFTGPQDWELWNDFVAVFVKDQHFAAQYPKRIIDHYPHFNALIAGREEIINYREWPEDQRTLVHSVRRHLHRVGRRLRRERPV
jgi:SAM-dependent methyltransferase